MAINLDDVKKETLVYYKAARKNLGLINKAILEHSQAISDVVPGYKAKELKFGSYDQDNFSVLFVDIRNSTERAQALGPDKTYLAYHAFFPALAYIVEHYNGHIIDFMGDGIMAVFGGKHSGVAHTVAAQNAGLCGIDIQKAIDYVVNPIIKEDEIKFLFNCGVGIDHGKVIVTKIGNDTFYDVKAFGDCINKASKLSKGKAGTVLVTTKIKDLWPSSKNGLIHFQQIGVQDGYLLNKSEV